MKLHIKGTTVLDLMYEISHSVQLAMLHMICFYVGHAVVRCIITINHN